MAGIDWCTLWPDLNYGEACCKPHDAAYDLGGSILDFLAANLDLGACVAALGHPGVAVLMAIGTTAFGWIWWLRARRRHPSTTEPFPAARAAFSMPGGIMFTNDEIGAIGEAARRFGLPEAHVLAVTEVESGGVSYATVDGRDEPLIRFEGHIFDRKLAGTEREAARAKGLSHPSAGRVKNPASQAARWQLLRKAIAINATAALEATSWGVGQVMAMHWKRLGFATVTEFVDLARSGLAGQVDVMLRFVRDAGLADELAAGQWAPFARAYNGPNYRTNRYDEKLAAAAAKFGGADDPPNGLLRMGSKGRRVRELQDLLVRSGAAVKVDGDFGPTTKAALVAFQTVRGLTPDGIYGPETETALGELRQASNDKPGALKLLDVGAVKRGAAAATGSLPLVVVQEKLQEAQGYVSAIGITSSILDYVQTGLTVGIAGCIVGGLVYAARGWFRSKQTVEA